MPDLKYPPQLTPAHWNKNKGLFAKAKPTGIGEALTKLEKAHDALDLALFDTGHLATSDAVAQALEKFEKEARKNFIKAFEEAKSVEDIATTAAAALKKAALVPKSAVDAANAVVDAASDYAVELTTVRQEGLAALNKLLESLRKSEARKQEDDDEVDENAPPNVIAEKIAKKVRASLKQLKSNDGHKDKPVQHFMIAAGKLHCGIFMGTSVGSSQKTLLKTLLSSETGPLKYYTGECTWEREAYTFVGDDVPLGGFVKRLQKTLHEVTEHRLKLRVRRTSGESEEADDSDAPPIPDVPPIPDAPPLPEAPKSSTAPRPSGIPTGDVNPSEELLKQRLKLMLPRLQILISKGGQTETVTRRAKDDILQKVAAKDFEAAAGLLDHLEQLAEKLGVGAQTATQQPIEPRDELRKEQLLQKARSTLALSKSGAESIAGTPKYKDSFLRQHGELLAEVERLALLEAPKIVHKALPGLIRRCELLQTRVSQSATQAADAIKNLDAWCTKRMTPLENSVKPPTTPPELAQAMAPAMETVRARIAQAQRLIDNGEFKKANDLSGAVYHEITNATSSVANFASQYGAYKVERDKAVDAIKALKEHKQAAAIAGEVGHVEAMLKQIDSVATANNGWIKAGKAVELVVKQCIVVTQLADRLESQSGKLAQLTRRLTEGGADPTTAARLGGYAHKLLVDEGGSEEDALQMARDVDEYVSGGMGERDALVSARVCKTLKDAKVEPAKAKMVGKAIRAGGTANADDAKVVAQGLSRLSVEVLENLLRNGISTECFRGGVTEVDPGSIGVVPRGWGSTGKTWDHVPGMFSSSKNQVLIGTMEKDGKRKVPGSGEVAGTLDGKDIAHGTPDLIGHESGHAFDVSDGDVKNKNAEFRAARDRDLKAGNIVKKNVPLPPVTTPPTAKAQPANSAKGMFVTRDDYFVVASEAGVEETGAESGSQANLDDACSETFAESFAMHFAGDSRWPELEKFWQNNPWGV